MPYIVELKLRDTRWEFATEAERDAKYDAVIDAMGKLEVPDDKPIVSKIDTQLSSFSGNVEEKRVGGTISDLDR